MLYVMATIAMTATFINRVNGAVVSRWADFVSALEAVRLGGVCELAVYGGAPTEYDEEGDVVEYGFDVVGGGVDDELYIMDSQWACVAVVRLVRDGHGIVREVVLVTAWSKYEYQYVCAADGGVKCVYRGAVHGLLAQNCLFDMSVSGVVVMESSRVGFVSGMTMEAFCRAYRLSFPHWQRARIGVGVDATWMDANYEYRMECKENGDDIKEDAVAYVDEEIDVMDQLRGIIVGSRVKRSMVLPETLNAYNRYEEGIVEFIREEICDVSEHRGKLGIRIEFPSAVRPGAGLGTTYCAYMSISDILTKGMFVQRMATGVDMPTMPDGKAIGATMRKGALICTDGEWTDSYGRRVSGVTSDACVALLSKKLDGYTEDRTLSIYKSLGIVIDKEEVVLKNGHVLKGICQVSYPVGWYTSSTHGYRYSVYDDKGVEIMSVFHKDTWWEVSVHTNMVIDVSNIPYRVYVHSLNDVLYISDIEIYGGDFIVATADVVKHDVDMSVCRTLSDIGAIAVGNAYRIENADGAKTLYDIVITEVYDRAMPDDKAIGCAMREGASVPVDGDKKEPKRRCVMGYVGQMPYYDVSEVHMETLTSGYGANNTRFVRMKDGYSVQADPLKRKDGTLIHISGQGWVYMSKVGYCLATLKGGMHGWTSPIRVGDGEWLMMNPWSDGDVLSVAQCVEIRQGDGCLYICRRGADKKGREYVSMGKYIHDGAIVEVMAIPFKGVKTVMHLLFNSYGAVKGLEAHGVEHSTKMYLIRCERHNCEVLTIDGVHYQLKGNGSLHHIADLNAWLIGVYEELMGTYDHDELLAYVGKMYSVCKEKRDNHVYRSNYNECYHERMKRSMMIGDEVVYEYSVTIYHGSGDKEVERACGVSDMSYSYDDDGCRLYEQTAANKLRLAYALGLLTIDDKEAVLDELTVIAEEQYADYLVKREAAKAVLTDEDKAALRAAFPGDCTWLSVSVRFSYCVKDDGHMEYERCLYRDERNGDKYVQASNGLKPQGIGIMKREDGYIIICTAEMQVLVLEYLGIGSIVKIEVNRSLLGYDKDDEGNIVYSINDELREDLRTMVAEHISIAGRVSSEYKWIDKAYGIGHRDISISVVSGSRMHDLVMLFQANHQYTGVEYSELTDVLYRMWDSGAKWSELLGNSNDTNNAHGYAHGEYQSIEVKEWGVRLAWNSTWNSSVKMCGGWKEDESSIKSVLWDGTVIDGEYVK